MESCSIHHVSLDHCFPGREYSGWDGANGDILLHLYFVSDFAGQVCSQMPHNT